MLNADTLAAEIKRIVAEEFGGDPVRRVEVEPTIDVDGEPVWAVLVILKSPLARSAPVLRVLRLANDFAGNAGDNRFVAVRYATTKEARERVE